MKPLGEREAGLINLLFAWLRCPLRRAALWDRCSCHPQPSSCSTSPIHSALLPPGPLSLCSSPFLFASFTLHTSTFHFSGFCVHYHKHFCLRPRFQPGPAATRPSALHLCFPAGKALHAVNAFHMFPRSQLNRTPKASQKHEKCIYTTLEGRCVP